MDLNLDTLKREILEYLEARGFAVFHSSPGGLEGQPMVLWDAERHPDYQISWKSRQEERDQADHCSPRANSQPERYWTICWRNWTNAISTREEQRDYRSAACASCASIEGVTCTLELAFDYHSRLYVYEVQPDWYDEFLSIEDEIVSQSESGEEDEDTRRYYQERVRCGGYLLPDRTEVRAECAHP